MSLAEGILGIVEEQARLQRFEKVQTVRLEIGALSNVELDALRFCFDVVTRNSIASRSSLEIDTIPGRGICLSCDEEVPLNTVYDPCPRCGEYGIRVIAGTEMRVKELEVD